MACGVDIAPPGYRIDIPTVKIAYRSPIGLDVHGHGGPAGLMDIKVSPIW